MTHIPDYVAGRDRNNLESELARVEALLKSEPTGLESESDDALNESWHNTMSEEEQLLDRLEVVKKRYNTIKNEMNRRVYLRMIQAGLKATGSLAE